MRYLVPAARQLVSQVTAFRPAVAWLAVGDTDGYGRTRTVWFDTDTADWLRPILEALQDDRIQGWTTADEADDMEVTFVGDIRADQATRYPIGVVADVLYG